MVDWHSMSIDEVIRELNTDPSRGLSSAEAKQRLLKNGCNEISIVKVRERRQGPRWSMKGVVLAMLSAGALITVALIVALK